MYEMKTSTDDFPLSLFENLDLVKQGIYALIKFALVGEIKSMKRLLQNKSLQH